MNQKKLNIVKEFIKYCKQELNIQTLPKISLINDPTFVRKFRSFGEYNPQDQSIKVFYPGRNLADVCRSLAHELAHHRQNELNLIYTDSGETGSDIENDANAMAGIIMRDFGKMNVYVYDLHTLKPLNEIGEGTSSYPWYFDSSDEDGNYFYSFKSPKNDYTVGIANLQEGMYELSFNTVDSSELDTNEGAALKVLSTVVEIAKDFIQKADPETVIFRPIKTKKNNKENDMRRSKLYGAYLKKHLPSNYNLMSFGDSYRIVKK